MFVELGVAGAVTYLYYRLFLNPKYYKYRYLIKDLSNNSSGFSNVSGKSIRFINYIDLGNTDRLIVNISKIVGYDDFIKKKDYLTSYFACKDIKFKKLDNANIQIDLIYDYAKIGDYDVIPQREYEVFAGYNQKAEPILVNMNKFPHMVIGGQTCSGKSRFLMQLLTNLVCNCKDVELFLFQIRKSDLILFKDCKQTKAIARNLEDSRDILKYLNDIAIKRDSLIEKLTNKNILNIEDYNRYSKFNKMKYIYVVLDEFSFFNVDGADDKYTKALKREILAYIKHLAVSSRSLGIFIITSLQKPTNSSLPSDIKSQLVTRICFKMGDDAESIVVLGNANAVNLEQRKCIVRTNKEEVCSTANIDIKIINNKIKDTIDKSKKYINFKKVNIDTKAKNINNDGVISEENFKNAFK
ncbi:FtsK/SpoIIIE domain-containing protein [Clostridium sp.]|uniref:FtsK/SpoIIIE domain-containing protein n=1 Tax=Clostridium sp. TaxID=1506 RepID=UPI001B725CCA|nr:FtsK/SpoIIIE domain-containing protein [Clostridium sp.]MBP3915928.1 hypothetical protein [Clostridium sp.]